MTMGFAVSLRNARLNQITAAIDAGPGAGIIRVYNGARPATGGAVTTLLAELTCTDPSAPAASAGVLTLSAINSDPTANATGTATWARVVDSTGTFVLDMSVGTSGADLNLNTVDVVAGVAVEITSAVITGGNP